MIHIRLMSLDDLLLAMRLKSQAGWNQVEADWRQFLSMQPDGCFVAELDRQPVGTTVTCIFGDLAWVAMVLVEASVRGRGVGTALMDQALAFLDATGVRSVRLDATPLGQPIYEKLGFEQQYILSRYDGVPAQHTHRHLSHDLPSVSAAVPEDFERVLALDREVTGTDRRKFLERLFEERPGDVWTVKAPRRDDRIEGYLATRPGSAALQLGPCLGTRDAGAALLTHAAARTRGRRIYLDVPQRNEAAGCLAESLGLTVQRTLVRMCRGQPVNDDAARLIASSGPELG